MSLEILVYVTAKRYMSHGYMSLKSVKSHYTLNMSLYEWNS